MPRRAYPSFFSGEGQTQLVVALANHGALTTRELVTLLGWQSRATLHHRAKRLVSLGVIVTYPWADRPRRGGGRKSPQYRNDERVWALDRRHPWFWQIRNFGRRLAIGFPLPGVSRLSNTAKRTYRGPLEPAHRMPTKSIFGERASDRSFMLLAHLHPWTPGVPIESLSRLLGVSRGLIVQLRLLERQGVLASEWRVHEHLFRLNTGFYAYRALRALCLRMDRDLGGEYRGIARARKIAIGTKALHTYRASRT